MTMCDLFCQNLPLTYVYAHYGKEQFLSSMDKSSTPLPNTDGSTFA